MAHRKLEMAKRIAKAETRIAGLHSIDEHLDLGNGLSLDNHRSALDQLREALHGFNKMANDAEALRHLCQKLGKELDNWNTRMQSAVGAKFGKESDEFSKAGGTRPSERKKAKKNPIDPLK